MSEPSGGDYVAFIDPSIPDDLDRPLALDTPMERRHGAGATFDATALYEIAAALRREVPCHLHPSADRNIGGYLCGMRDAYEREDAAEFVRLGGLVCSSVVRELRYHAENFASAGAWRDAHRARCQAERFARRWGRFRRRNGRATP
jgi:hypothetical protein